ncbi:MAG TPA: ABC transporter substrate-binding protein [Eubacteriales bacterium]|nr:ABC transporter substrate-binding protein [Eubacteriales bacterium]
MKHLVKTIAIIALSLMFALSMMAGCAKSETSAATDETAAETTAAEAAATEEPAASEAPAEETFTVGVLQFGSHPSLDNCYAGIAEVLGADSRITIDLQDGNFDSPTCDTIAKNMAAKEYDMIIAIATPAAISAYAATANTDIPVIFSAVSDPLAAGLVDDMTTPGGNCTGTSDVLDLSAQLEMIRAFQPDAVNLGVLYTTSEANSVSQLKTLNELAPEYGFTVVSQGVQTAADIPQAAATLCAGVDCITNFTDNNVVNNLAILLEQANAAGVPVYGSEDTQVTAGCLASVSLDYTALGRVTGQMALDVLGGADASAMAVQTITDAVPVVNSDVLAAFGMTLPEAYASVTLVTTAAE